MVPSSTQDGQSQGNSQWEPPQEVSQQDEPQQATANDPFTVERPAGPVPVGHYDQSSQAPAYRAMPYDGIYGSVPQQGQAYEPAFVGYQQPSMSFQPVSPVAPTRPSESHQLESFLGRFVLSGLAGLMIIAAAASFVGVLWWQLSDTQRVATLAAIGVVLMMIGSIVSLKKIQLWIVGSTLLATGASLCGVAIVVSGTVFRLLPVPWALIAMTVWTVVLVVITYVLRDYLTTIITAIGIVYMTGGALADGGDASIDRVIIVLLMIIVYIGASNLSVWVMMKQPSQRPAPKHTVLFLIPVWAAAIFSSLTIMLESVDFLTLDIIIVAAVVMMGLFIAYHLIIEHLHVAVLITFVSYMLLTRSYILYDNMWYSQWAGAVFFIAVWTGAIAGIFLLPESKDRTATWAVALFWGLVTTASMMSNQWLDSDYYDDDAGWSSHFDVFLGPYILIVATWLIVGYCAVLLRSHIARGYTPLVIMLIPPFSVLQVSGTHPMIFWIAFIAAVGLMIFAGLVVSGQINNTDYYQEVTLVAPAGIQDANYIPFHNSAIPTVRKRAPEWKVWSNASWTIGIAAFLMGMFLWRHFIDFDYGIHIGLWLYTLAIVTTINAMLFLLGFTQAKELCARYDDETKRGTHHFGNDPRIARPDGSFAFWGREVVSLVVFIFCFIAAPIGQRMHIDYNSDFPGIKAAVITTVVAVMLVTWGFMIFMAKQKKATWIDLCIIVGVFYFFESVLHLFNLVDFTSALHTVIMIVTGVVALAAGFYNKRKASRIIGLVIIILGVLKLTIIDVASGEVWLRIIALVIGAVVCLIISIAYTKIETELLRPESEQKTSQFNG
ncbi:MAG: hypothetical protein Q4P66_07055 [Actinomycetaceae bacterium]|nr:hypothetical protein [Actinomycetaceae bacterium]